MSYVNLQPSVAMLHYLPEWRCLMSAIAIDRAEAGVFKCILFAYSSLLFGCAVAAYGMLAH